MEEMFESASLKVQVKKADHHIYDHSDVAMVMVMKTSPTAPIKKVVIQFARDMVEAPEGEAGGIPVPLRLISSTITMSKASAMRLAKGILAQLEDE